MYKRPDFLDCPNKGEERRSIERRMSRCFTWFPNGGYRRTQYIPRFGGGLQECGDFTWKVSDWKN